MEDFFFYSSLKIVIETHCQSGFGLMGWSKKVGGARGSFRTTVLVRVDRRKGISSRYPKLAAGGSSIRRAARQKKSILGGFSLSIWRGGRVSLRPRPKRSQGDGRRGQGQRPAHWPIEKGSRLPIWAHFEKRSPDESVTQACCWSWQIWN